ncbi:MAG: hypothetical protein NTW03_12965 [Verrucomicrobia bacterium]|nr:hypothetical protein [Verrucomicrobiota bacterium]
MKNQNLRKRLATAQHVVLAGLLMTCVGRVAAAELDLFVTDYNENPTPEQRPMVYRAINYPNAEEATVKAGGKLFTYKTPASVAVSPANQGLNPREARLFASIGEYEPFSFLLRPKESLEDVMIAGSDLKGPAGVIPAANVVVTSVEEFHGAGRQMLMPLGKPWNMGGFMAEFFWCTIKVPDQARAGTYTGEVAVTSRGQKVGAITVVLEVLPIRLEDPPFGLGYNYSSPKDAKALELQLADMRAHGMTTVGALYNFHLPVYDHDTSELAEFIQAYQKAGYPGVFYFATPMELELSALAGFGNVDSRRFQQKYIQVMRALHDEVRKHRVPAIMSIGDEFTNRGLEGTMIAGKLAHLTWEELPEIATTSDMNGYMEVMAMAPFLNIATFNNGWDGIDHHNKGRHLLNRNFLEELQSKTLAVPWFVNAGTGRFPFGLFFWKMTHYGARGKVEWYYNLGKNERGSVVHLDGRNIHPTMDYERSREGIDDLKYLCQLEQLVNQATKARQAPAQVKTAAAVLAGISNAIADDWTIYDTGTRFSIDGFGVVDAEKAATLGQLNATREAVARQIVQLQAALAK